MAVIWQKTVAGIKHEVRAAGASRRLYTDGVFHSQYNPQHPAGGHIWDLLMLPAFFTQPYKIKRILILGAGGGAVMQQLNYFLSADVIVGIDNNPQHIYVAKRYFAIKDQPFKLIEADAIKWVAEYDGEPFDLVIDDLYGEFDGEPCRAIEPDASWFLRLHHLLAPSGILVMNFMSTKALKASAWSKDDLFASVYRLNMANYENVIGVFCRKIALVKDFKQRLRQYPELDQRRKTTKLCYQLRKLK